MNELESKRQPTWKRAIFGINWVPTRCREDPSKPPTFSNWLNFLFAFTCMFSVANLYYTHPILNILADDFGISYKRASNIPTVMQAGYAAGLLFICPLGDILKRRALTINLIFVTATIWIGLCITKNFETFTGLSFLVAMTTVSPQIMLPLVAGIAPPPRRQTAISVLLSGILLGILVARLLSAIITQYTNWRNVYWLSLGLQYLLVVLLWFFMPDYPSVNPEGLSYPRTLWSIVTLTVQEPLLVQANIIAFFISAIFTSYWTVLAGLLSSAPYNYSTLVIGLFALIGIASLCTGPPYSRYVMGRFHPMFSVLLGEFIALVGVLIGTFTGSFSVAGPVILAFAIDVGMQFTQVANRASIYNLRPLARSRINTSYTVFVFSGQLMGTAVGNKLYAEGGWVLAGEANIAFVGVAIVATLLRGPRATGWVGWHGGWNLKPEKTDAQPPTAAPAAGAGDMEKGQDSNARSNESGTRSVKTVNESGGLDRGKDEPRAESEHPENKAE